MVSCITSKDFLKTVEGSIKLETKHKALHIALIYLI